ncbi:hypothetical protein ANCCAN_22539 [Ancylostoma caninum]|uniref:Uncharacterized protein n=1 Tax=Ancylostoma caninum TaxID=29170 RepID=A0A368FNB4_ANCCA|nr:hypothetical protein ANCCAN_22539 [Ancylostoma caninum]
MHIPGQYELQQLLVRDLLTHSSLFSTRRWHPSHTPTWNLHLVAQRRMLRGGPQIFLKLQFLLLTFYI